MVGTADPVGCLRYSLHRSNMIGCGVICIIFVVKTSNSHLTISTELPLLYGHHISPVLSRCALHPNSTWVWEREAHINWSMVTCQGSTRSELP